MTTTETTTAIHCKPIQDSAPEKNPAWGNPNDQFYITDKVSRFNEIANMFLKKQIKNIKYIQL